jgi:hypothetical protein
VPAFWDARDARHLDARPARWRRREARDWWDFRFRVVALVQAARRLTSHTVKAMSNADNANSQPPSIHWNVRKRVTG